jgi:hypothetical protein
MSHTYRHSASEHPRHGKHAGHGHRGFEDSRGHDRLLDAEDRRGNGAYKHSRYDLEELEMDQEMDVELRSHKIR